MAMMRSERQISYGEFGRRMIAHAVRPEVIQQNLERAVPQEQEIVVGPSAARVLVRTQVGAVRELASGGEELGYVVPLTIELTLGVNLLVSELEYATRAALNLRMEVQTLDPLLIFIDCAPVTAEEVRIEPADQSGLAEVVQRLGVLDGAIQQQMAAALNAQIEASAAERTIDLRRLMDETMADPEAMQRAVGG